MAIASAGGASLPAVPPSQLELVRRACRLIDEHPDGPPTLAALGGTLGVSPYHLQRVFKRVTGISPRAYADARRLGRLKRRLRAGGGVAAALYDAGYGSSSRLYEQAPTQLGMTPAAYHRGGAGMRIAYTIVDSPLGRLLLGATERGICSVAVGDSDAALEAAIGAEYPAADVRRDDGAVHPWVGELLAHLHGEQPDLALPVDVRATAFQRRVWQELRTIPYGETRSYAEVAAALGAPSAARAVARACATNPVAIIVPCHRVVRGDGTLGGYRWGLERKRRLLDAEARAAAAPLTAPGLPVPPP
jgi:AraC family transcriptional regulator, regulatory protein of adaptative response / methylated-DNA-[protein]-cysteine methyltransferase